MLNTSPSSAGGTCAASSAAKNLITESPMHPLRLVQDTSPLLNILARWPLQCAQLQHANSQQRTADADETWLLYKSSAMRLCLVHRSFNSSLITATDQQLAGSSARNDVLHGASHLQLQLRAAACRCKAACRTSLRALLPAYCWLVPAIRLLVNLPCKAQAQAACFGVSMCQHHTTSCCGQPKQVPAHATSS